MTGTIIDTLIICTMTGLSIVIAGGDVWNSGLSGAALTSAAFSKVLGGDQHSVQFLLMLCLRVYTRHLLRHVSWPILGGLLTALTDETVQLFVPGRSGQVTDIWIDFSGVMTGLMVGLILLGLIRMCILLYKHRNED